MALHFQFQYQLKMYTSQPVYYVFNMAVFFYIKFLCNLLFYVSFKSLYNNEDLPYTPLLFVGTY